MNKTSKGVSSIIILGIGLITAFAAVGLVAYQLGSSDKDDTPINDNASVFNRLVEQVNKESKNSEVSDTNIKEEPEDIKVEDQQETPDIQQEEDISVPPKEETPEEPIADEKDIEEDDENDEPSVPSNNDDPKIRLISYKVKDEVLWSEKPVHLQAEVTDKIGGIDKVEFYVNGKKVETVEKRNMYTKESSKWDADEADRATSEAADYLEDKYDEDSPKYWYRKYFKEDGDSGCDISEGYLLSMKGENTFYDVRVSRDGDDVDVCHKGNGFNDYDLYHYLYKGKKGEYEFYMKAYDIYGESTKSEKIWFELD